jgi:replication-associated recombination protein RarA
METQNTKAGKGGKAKTLERKTETKSGYKLDEVISAFHKEVSRGHEELATFWALEALASTPSYFLKRLLIQASEDVGLADPDAVRTVISLVLGFNYCKSVSRWYVDPQAVVHAVLTLCRAKKDTTVDDLKTLTEERMGNKWHPEIPEYALDDHTARGRELRKQSGKKGWGEFYKLRRTYAPDSIYFEKLKAEFPEFVGNDEE